MKLGATVKASRGIIARLKARSGVKAKWLAHGELLLSKRESPKDPVQVVQELIETLEQRAIKLYQRGYLVCDDLKRSTQEVEELGRGLLDSQLNELREGGAWWPGWWGGPLAKVLWPPPS